VEAGAGAGAGPGEGGGGGSASSGPSSPLVHPGPSAPVLGVSGGAGCVGPSGFPCTLEERQARSHRLWRLASEQGNVQATLLVGDAYFYGRVSPTVTPPCGTCFVVPCVLYLLGHGNREHAGAPVGYAFSMEH